MLAIRFLSYTPPRTSHAALLLAVFLGGCAGGESATYTGKLTPIAGTCDATNRATLFRHANTVQFTPQDGVMILEGTISKQGVINASQQTMGMDRKPYRLEFTGQASGQAVTGIYATSRCRYSVSLLATNG